MTQERRYALPAGGEYGIQTGTFLSYVATAECGHDDYGNPAGIGVDTHAIDPFPGAVAESPVRAPAGAIPCGASDPSYEASVETRKRSINTWANDPATWQLGRLMISEIQHARRVDGALVSDSRIASFNYFVGGTKSGLLKDEWIRTLAPNDELRTYYELDDYGNRVAAYTCSVDVTEADCRDPLGSQMKFHPLGTQDEPTKQVRRYSRTSYDSIGRYTTGSKEPFYDPSVPGREWSESSTSTACSLGALGPRDEFGESQCVDDANGVTVKSIRGSFGRDYWSWNETISGSDTGVTTTITYAWCTSNNQSGVSCPLGAIFRRQIVNTISGTSWAYFDILGREMAAVTQSFNVNVQAQDLAIVCMGFDARGQAFKSTEPRFLSGAVTSEPDFTSQPNICTSAPANQQTTTTFDVLARVVKIVAPDGGETSTTFAGLTTTVRAPCNNEGGNLLCAREWVEVKNASGEAITATDPTSFSVHFSRDKFGNVTEVKRDAGRGDIFNTAIYDERGLKTQQTDADGGTWFFLYNAAGEMIKRTDARGQTTRFDIDARGRVWRTRASSVAANACSDCLFASGFEDPGMQTTLAIVDTIQYDTAPNALGLVHWDSRTEPGNSTVSRTLNYDTLARPLTKSTLLDGKTYTETTVYDQWGRVLKSLTAYTETYNNPNGPFAYAEGAEYVYGLRGHVVRVCRAVDASNTPNFRLRGRAEKSMLAPSPMLARSTTRDSRKRQDESGRTLEG